MAHGLRGPPGFKPAGGEGGTRCRPVASCPTDADDGGDADGEPQFGGRAAWRFYAGCPAKEKATEGLDDD
eukprot:652676-Heterocapsa_arctica.AAC.1